MNSPTSSTGAMPIVSRSGLSRSSIPRATGTALRQQATTPARRGFGGSARQCRTAESRQRLITQGVDGSRTSAPQGLKAPASTRSTGLERFGQVDGAGQAQALQQLDV
jgi:hypothetical protein